MQEEAGQGQIIIIQKMPIKFPLLEGVASCPETGLGLGLKDPHAVRTNSEITKREREPVLTLVLLVSKRNF